MKGTIIVVDKGFPWGWVIGATLVVAAGVGGAYWYYRSRSRRGVRGLAQLSKTDCGCGG